MCSKFSSFAAFACSSALLVALASPVIANDGDHSEIKETLERVEKKVDDIAHNTDATKVVIVDEPLQGKTQGFEINPIRFLMMDSEESTIAGTYSRFLVDKKVEIAFPFMWTSTEHDEFWARDEAGGKSASSFTLDMHYRKFLGHKMDGFYISGFARAVALSGVLEDSASTSSHSEFKLGGGFGVGYRIFSTSNFYWGASISLGRYLIGDSDIYEDTDSISFEFDDAETILDVEFFKFGYAF